MISRYNMNHCKRNRTKRNSNSILASRWKRGKSTVRYYPESLKLNFVEPNIHFLDFCTYVFTYVSDMN